MNKRDEHLIKVKGRYLPEHKITEIGSSKNFHKYITEMDIIEKNALDFTKSEETLKNIIIPNSQFTAKWEKDKGYAIGIENIKLTKDYETLEEALNQIGYGVDKDEEGDDILVKLGDVDYEMIVRIMKGLLIIEDLKNN